MGIDISSEMLRRLDVRLKALPGHTCRVSLVHQTSEVDIARLAGWTLVRRHDGDEPAISLPGHDTPLAFGQSIGVFE